jgi:hypothetical protein
MPSTVIRSIEYNAATAVLTIVFVTGSVYEYYEVPQEVYEQVKGFVRVTALLPLVLNFLRHEYADAAEAAVLFCARYLPKYLT